MSQLDVYMGKRSKIVEEVNNTAVILNDIYNAWQCVKDAKDHKNLMNTIKATRWGTYHQWTLIDMLEKFGATYDSIPKQCFLREITVALKGEDVCI